MHVTHGYKHKNISGVDMPCGHYVCLVVCWEIYPWVPFLCLQLSRIGEKRVFGGFPSPLLPWNILMVTCASRDVWQEDSDLSLPIVTFCSLLPAALSFHSLGDASPTLHVTQEELLAQSKFNAVCLHLKGWGPSCRYTLQRGACV